MKLSLILTVNNRTPEVSKAVADSLRLEGNQPDELVVVLDRPTREVEKGAMEAYSTVVTGHKLKFAFVPGPAGWLGPARAWNHGFRTATGDYLYLISSEVVQDAGNLRKAREYCENHPNMALFGACHNSKLTQEVQGFAPGLLADSSFPRPLGFICCLPADKVKEIGGFDETFMNGFWYDDDDFFLRLWGTGLDFTFTDDIHGVHQHHERPDLATPEGQAKIKINQDCFQKKHGNSLDFIWPNLPRITSRTKNSATWMHP